jgi:hypothetical protein
MCGFCGKDTGWNRSVTIYLRVESAEVKQVLLQILTAESYQNRSRLRLLWFGIYYGIIMAMFLYNLILFISLRELNRLYYLLYLLSMGLIYFVGNGLLWEFFVPGSHLNRVLSLIFICFAFFWGNFFAKSFLIAQKNAPFFDKLLSVFMVYSIVLAAMIPLVDKAWITFAVFSQGIIVPPAFLLAGIESWKHGFRPARFFLIAFAILALSVIFETLVTFGVLPYLTPYSSQVGSAIEVILLQLALADRIKTLSQEQNRIRQSLYLVDEEWNYKAYTKTALKNGQIIFLSTDGIWEARNLQGEMFGKERIYNIIQKKSSLSAGEIINIMIESLKSFQQDAQIEDDITMVVIKIN